MDENQDDRPGEATAKPAARKKGSVARYQVLEPTLFVTDEELIRRLGVPDKAARAALHVLDREKHRGFPQKQAQWGNRRYWPAVRQWFDRHYGLERTRGSGGAGANLKD